MVNDPDQLFELFYKNITFDMNPPGFPKYETRMMEEWWRERFMNALHGIQEPLQYRSWGEAPQMWLAGYRQFLEEEKQQQLRPEPKPEFVPPPPLISIR